MQPRPPSPTLFPYTTLFRSHYPISAIEPMEQRMLLAAALTPVGTQPAGALSGRIIFTSGGHGFTAANTSGGGDRKSTRLNSSHRCISYAVFCLKKKNEHIDQ